MDTHDINDLGYVTLTVTGEVNMELFVILFAMNRNVI
jgi:hypothetical protein